MSMSSLSDLRFYDLGNCASGSWYVLHLLAANGETDALKTVLKTFSKRFVCPKCRFHIRDYLKSNPFPSGSATTTSRSFEWTVAFHNAVNVRLGKATLTDEERDDLFLELTTKADEDEKKIMQGGDCEGCSGVGATTTLRETIEKSKTRRSASFPAPTSYRQQWPSINVSYSK